jgi:hypothetical protein
VGSVPALPEARLASLRLCSQTITVHPCIGNSCIVSIFPTACPLRLDAPGRHRLSADGDAIVHESLKSAPFPMSAPDTSDVSRHVPSAGRHLARVAEPNRGGRPALKAINKRFLLGRSKPIHADAALARGRSLIQHRSAA